MKFSRLKLHGFKSFCDPTELHLEPGLSGVVGPNGCGKSNLVEALRWVMGESSYKAMRASGMDDEEFAEKLLREEHVAVVPGNAFGPGGDGFVRMCYATAYEQIEEALQRMEKFMSRYG